jgi:uncharacterized membrane protein
MANETADEKATTDTDTDTNPDQVVRKIGPADLWDVLAKGIDDFKAKPSHILLLVFLYPIVGLILVRLTAGYDILPLIFPILAGFALLGPMAAIGLYELSRRRELGLDVTWGHAFDVLRSPSIGAIVTLSIVMMALYFSWLGAAMGIYGLFFGAALPTSIVGFVLQVLTTPAGWGLIIVGGGVGFLFAVLVLAISVVSFPMLIDQNVSAMTAILTSVRSVVANPLTMAMWGFIVAGSLVAGSIPFLFGLAVVMPVLGHATWHLYRKVVER